MFIKHSLKNALRSWPKSVLFLLLLTALSATLCIGVSLTAAIMDFLRECDDNYSTIAVFEYIGVDYPDESTYDPGIAKCADEFDFDALAKNPCVLSWDRNEVAFGSIAGKEAGASRQPYDDYTIAVVYIMSFNENLNAYQYAIEKDLVNPDSDSLGGYLDVGDEKLETRHFYLVHGKFGSSKYRIGNNQYVRVEPFSNAAAELAGVSASIEDMLTDVTTGRVEYEIPEGHVLLDLAETYAAVNKGVTVHATNDLNNLLPFHQTELTIVEGRSFTADEYTSGSNVCVLPQRLAELLEAGVGDQIDLSLAVCAGATQAESYWAGTGYAYSGSYTIVGILNPNDDYRDTVFIPKSDTVDLSENAYAFTLGQALLKNDRAGQFYEEMEDTLPPRVRMTMFDQGYEAAAEPLRDVLRIALIITAVCSLTTLAILALFGFLFVYRQRGLSRVMRRNGAANSGIYQYFLFGSGLISLLSAAAGAFISRRLSGRVMDLVRQSISEHGSDNLRYSNAALSIAKPMDFMTDIKSNVFAYTVLVLFIAALIACFVFAAISIRSLRAHVSKRALSRMREKGRAAPRRAGSRSHSLSGGALKYAWLSVVRGAFRSAIPFVLCALAAVLLLQLTGATVAYEKNYDELVQATDINGFVTDFRGMWRDGLMVESSLINSFWKSGLLSDISITKTMHHGYGIEPPEVWNIYTYESYQTALGKGPGLIFTNDLAAVQEFFSCRDLPVTFMDGYSLSTFSEIPLGLQPLVSVADSEGNYEMREHEITPVLVSADFLEENEMEYGDEFFLTAYDGETSYNNEVKIIGSYIRQGTADNIYVPLSEYSLRYSVSESDSMKGPGGEEVMYMKRTIYDIPASYVFDPEADEDLMRYLTFGSLSFRMKGAAGLTAFKDFLYDQGYSEVNLIRTLRRFITIEDKTFLTTERTMSQRLWYMQKTFPVLFVLLELMAALIPFILIKLRKRESAMMRVMGAAKSTAFMSLFLEQVILCLPGVAAGAGVWLLTGGVPDVNGLYLAVLFGLLWLIGTGVSAFSLNRGSVRTILRAAE